MPHFARRTGMSFLANPDKCEKRRKQAAAGGFLLDTFLWRKTAPAFSAFTTSMWLSAQRKVSRPWVREPTLKSIVALATLLNTPHPNPLPQGERECSFVHPLTSSGRTVLLIIILGFWIPAIPAGMTGFLASGFAKINNKLIKQTKTN